MTETPTKECRGRPAIETRELESRRAARASLESSSRSCRYNCNSCQRVLQRHPDAKACLEGCLQDQLDQTHSILIEAAPEAAQCLIDIIRDGRCKPYSKIEAIKTLLAIVEKGKTEREVADALKSLKDQLTALEGGTPNVIDV